MNKAFFTGASGLRAYQYNIDIVGHNISNSATAGYKVTKPEFRDLIYTNMDANKNRETDEQNSIKEGHGVKVQNDDLVFTQGAFATSDYALDFAIAGDGLFAVMNDDTTIEYTRNGCFDVSVEGNNAYLVDSSGRYVLDSQYQKINIERNPGSNTLNIDYIKPRLGVFSFDNPQGLIRTNGASFIQSENSGEPQVAQLGSYTILQSTFERSNVELSQEMTNLIVAQKAYQFSARVVTTADEIEQLINSLRG